MLESELKSSYNNSSSSSSSNSTTLTDRDLVEIQHSGFLLRKGSLGSDNVFVFSHPGLRALQQIMDASRMKLLVRYTFPYHHFPLLPFPLFRTMMTNALISYSSMRLYHGNVLFFICLFMRINRYQDLTFCYFWQLFCYYWQLFCYCCCCCLCCCFTRLSSPFSNHYTLHSITPPSFFYSLLSDLLSLPCLLTISPSSIILTTSHLLTSSTLNV